jgi:pilus assembly protein CpaF
VLTPSVRLQGALRSLMERMAQHVDVYAPVESAFSTHNGTVLEGLIDELAQDGEVSADIDRVFLRDAAISEAFGLGPLDRLLANSSVREIVLDGPQRISVDMGGGLSTVSAFFSSKQALLCAAQRLLARGGQAVVAELAVQECVLPNGSYVQVLMPPLAVRGPLVSIRCAPRMPLNIESLVTQGMLSNDMSMLLRSAIRNHRNVVVLGAAGVGVTTALGVLASLALDHERVVTVEDVPALTLDHPNALSIRRGVQQSLDEVLRRVARLRYDLIALDDVRGDVTRDALLLAAERTGVLIGFHAQSIEAALKQLELFSRLPQAAGLIAQAIHVLVQVELDRDGVRRVVSIAEVVGARDEALTVRELYRFDGSFRATEHRASFLS